MNGCPGDLLRESDPLLFKTPSSRCAVYKRRWYVLFVFTIITIVSNMMWNTWGPIQGPCKVAFGVEDWQILLLSSWGASAPIMGSFISTWLMDAKGLRVSALYVCLLMVVGKALQALPIANADAQLVMINVGHFITMFPAMIANGAPPVIAATWFPMNELTTATTIVSLAAFAGVGAAFIMGPALVPQVPVNDTLSVKLNISQEHLKQDIMDYTFIQTGIAAALFVCVLIYLPAKPPLPPSIAVSRRHLGFKDGIKRLLRNGPFWWLAVVFGVQMGVIGGWQSVLDIAVSPFGIDEITAGWLGFAAAFAGFISGILLARFADFMKHVLKKMIIFLLTGSTLAQLIFSLACARIIPSPTAVLYASIIVGALLYGSITPLLFELVMECVYPVGEGLAVGVLLFWGNGIVLVFDIAFMFPSIDVKWMNWVTVISLGILVPGLVLYREKYRRLDADNSAATAAHEEAVTAQSVQRS